MRSFFIIALLALTGISFGQKQRFVTRDIDGFWKAYEKITTTADTARQYQYLKDLYIDQASPGLKSLIEVRRYTNKEFVDAINNYPQFWRSLQPKTKHLEKLFPEIEADLDKLKKAYPNLKRATVYFAIGAFRTNGTTQQDRVLIGAEAALADDRVCIDELPLWRQPFYKGQSPRSGLSLLCTHEYIHTQQKPLVQNLLSMCLYEGVAEFISCKVTGRKSNVAAIDFGKANQRQVIEMFIPDLFTMSNNYNWIWGENQNALKVRDLGYYIGYEICERYYNRAADKTKAIQELIELDYEDENQVERIVDQSNLLPEKLSALYDDYEKRRPTVIAIAPFANGSQHVKPGTTAITITFSEPLNGLNTGVDFGPLGQNHCPKLSPNRKWSDDARSWTIEAELLPDTQYQILISNNFRKTDQTRLKPFLIDFRTAE